MAFAASQYLNIGTAAAQLLVSDIDIDFTFGIMRHVKVARLGGLGVDIIAFD